MPKKENDKKQQALAVGGTVGVASGLARNPIRSLLNKAKGEKNSEKLQNLFNQMDEQDIHHDTIPKDFPVDFGYFPEHSAVGYKSKDSMNPHHLAHEMGHAQYDKGLTGEERLKNFKRDRSLYDFSKKYSPAIAGLGVGTHMAIKDEHPTKAKLVAGATLAGTGLPMLPLLHNEARASINAIKNLREAGGVSKGDLEGLIKGWGSYGVEALPFLASAGYFAHDALRKSKEDDEEDAN